jgi:hypothetical protein
MEIAGKITSMPASKPVLTSTEMKLLYTLLDAAHDDGLLREGPLLTRWLEIKQAAAALPMLDRPSLYKLVEEIDATGALKNTWMRERWLALKWRVENEPMEFSPSQSPFPPR